MASNELEVLDPAAKDEKLEDRTAGRVLNRRNLLAGFGIAGVSIGAGLMSRSSVKRPSVVKAASGFASSYSQVDYLNYLLNIKYLQATLYAFITTGYDIITAAGSTFPTPYNVTNPAFITSPPINGTPINPTMGEYSFDPIAGGVQPTHVPVAGTKVTFTGPNSAQITDMLNEIYYDELNQLINLQNLIGPLGTVAIVRPPLDLIGTGTGPSSAAVTSTTYTASGTGPVKALGVLRMLEDIAVTAFAGVAQYLSGANLAGAAQIFAIDGQHSGAIRLAIILQNASGITVPDQLADSAVNPGNGAYYPEQADDVAPVDTGAAAAATGPILVPISTKTVSATTAGPLLASTTQQVLPTNWVAFTATTTSGSLTITLTGSGVSNAGFSTGQLIVGPGIPAGTTVSLIPTNSTTTLTLSAAATASATGVTLSYNNTIIAPCTQPIQPYGSSISATNASYTSCTPPQFEGFFDTTGAAAAASVGTWSSATTYQANQAVYYNGSTYLSLQGSNANQNPATSPTYWSIIASGIYSSSPPAPGFAFARTPSQVFSLLYGNLSTDGITGVVSSTGAGSGSGNSSPAAPALASGSSTYTTAIIYDGGFFPDGFSSGGSGSVAPATGVLAGPISFE
jgi:hypothetical protein